MEMDKTHIYLYYEFIKGQTLQNIIENEDLDIEEIRDIFHQICSGVKYMHKK